MIIRYPDGETDGEEIRCPTTDESVNIQRHVCRDMKNNPNKTIFDSSLRKRVSIQEFFDMHVMTLLIIHELEEKFKDIDDQKHQ